MSVFKNYDSRIAYLKSISDYHFDRFLPEPQPFHIIGHFENRNWMEEIRKISSRSSPFTLFDLVENSAKRGRRNLQFDVSLNQDTSYKQDLVLFHTFSEEVFNRNSCPTLFKMVDWFGMEANSVIPRIHVQHPGQVFPYHIDALTKNSDGETAHSMRLEPGQWARVQIQLEDWVWGHVWSIGNSYWAQWRAGEIMYHPWWTMPHGTANCGYSPRYSFQISGKVTSLTQQRLSLRNQKIDLGTI